MFFKSQPIRLMAVIAFALTAATARADVIIERQGTSYIEQSNTFAALAEIVVGSADVHINGIGVFGQTSVPTNVKWVIFDSLTPASPTFLSDMQAIAGTPGSYATSARWYRLPADRLHAAGESPLRNGTALRQTGSDGIQMGNNADQHVRRRRPGSLSARAHHALWVRPRERRTLRVVLQCTQRVHVCRAERSTAVERQLATFAAHHGERSGATAVVHDPLRIAGARCRRASPQTRSAAALKKIGRIAFTVSSSVAADAF